jgi:hypothetical protein
MKKFVVFLVVLEFVMSMLYGVGGIEKNVCDDVVKQEGIDFSVFSVIYSCVVDMVKVFDTAMIVKKIDSFKGVSKSKSLPVDGSSKDRGDRDKVIFITTYQILIFAQFMISSCIFLLFIFSLGVLCRRGYDGYNFVVSSRYKHTNYMPRSSISDTVINMFR